MNRSSTPSAPASEDVDALGDLLATEHGVIYGYGVAGAAAAAGSPQRPAETGTTGPVTGPAEVRAAAAVAQAATGLDVHRTRRDALIDRIRALGGIPPEPLPAYQLPVTPHDAVSALRLIGQLEDDVAVACHAALVRAATGQVRDFAAGTLADAAGRGARARLTAGDPPATVLGPLPGS
jgi:hypothetical protein